MVKRKLAKQHSYTVKITVPKHYTNTLFSNLRQVLSTTSQISTIITVTLATYPNCPASQKLSFLPIKAA
ncbi:hypothetical protein L596_030006 [Steinernema carpocapsae]|uniref:Uncharacterized protein n=1 Tax=Steinernema carpocapsae TaxID=34508 RepID=A0A4U5LRG7_STECR|nr:hypothetical protein L596_030006 [Steinernema carpocapsae]